MRRKKKTIHLIAGSTSDMPAILPIVREFYDHPDLTYVFHVFSCHRHLFQLIAFLISLIFKKGVWIIAYGSKAFALPGIICAILNLIRKPIPVIGVALKGSEPDDLEAARLSLTNLPGKPVIVYVGVEGFECAIRKIMNSDAYPVVPFKDPPPHYTNLTLEQAEDLIVKLAKKS